MKKITIFEILIIIISLTVIIYYFSISFKSGFSDVEIVYNKDKIGNIQILSSIIRKDLDLYTSGFNPGNSNFSFYIFNGIKRPEFSEKLIQYTIEDNVFIRKDNADITHKINNVVDFNIQKKNNIFFVFIGNNEYKLEIIEHSTEKKAVEEY
ncbi:MAG: hypothetical protein M0R46_12895 [Candidatus Muirbacterium halophilum]|nr:hypothetical protein [Candidatus Muirbacterium halophilum]MCK9476816.1 hypothetical protein [Candidatus Muirbacterium halophilum]